MHFVQAGLLDLFARTIYLFGMSSGDACEIDTDWLSLAEAAARLTSDSDSLASAKANLATLMKSGQVTAACDAIAFGADAGAIRDSLPQVSSSHFGSGYAAEILSAPSGAESVLHQSFWLHSFDWDKDVARWNWEAGTVVVSRPPPIKYAREQQAGRSPDQIFGTRMVALNTCVSKKDIEAIAPKSGAKPKRGGGRLPQAAWHEWVAELAAHIHNVGVPAKGYTAYELIKDVNNALAERGYDGLWYGTAQKAAEATLARLRHEFSTIPE